MNLTGRTSERERGPNVYLPPQRWRVAIYIYHFSVINIMLLTGTVVSLQTSNDSDLTNPISQRLRSRDTVLTKTADPSLLVHALLDLSMRLTLIKIGQSLIVIIQLWTRPSKSLINTSLILPI